MQITERLKFNLNQPPKGKKPKNMKKTKSITQTINRTNFRKVVNYHLNGRGKVVKISTFTADVVVFDILTNKGSMLFSIDTNFNFMDAIIKNDQIKSTWNFRRENLKHLLNQIDFFARDEKSRAKMNFPVITLK